MMPVPALRSSRESQDKSGLDFGKHALERHGWHVVALVRDHVPVRGHNVVYSVLADHALDHGDVESAITLVLATPYLTHLSFVDAEEHRELGDPLVQEWSTVDEHEGAAAAFGHEPGAENRFPHAWWRDQDAHVVRDERTRRLILDGGELSAELESHSVALVTLVVDNEGHGVLSHEGLEIAQTPTR